MNIVLHITDRDGVQHQSQVPAEGTLMEALRDLNHDIAAICGGMCACATCHVYVDPNWLPLLTPPGDDEVAMVSELEWRTNSSRLSCQISLDTTLDGLLVAIAPEE